MNEDLKIELRSILLSDIANCMLLSKAEGWNQTEQDWKLLVDNPENTCLLAECEHSIIGSATAMNYSDEIAWIGMMLVDKVYRGRGISKMLLSGLINKLQPVRSVKLDATPAGHPVYEKFGFKDEYILHRMTTLCLDDFHPFISGDTPEPILSSDISEVITLDGSIFGTERISLIKSLINGSPDSAWCIKRDGRITAFVLGRSGRKYHQIGPLFASSLIEAMVLISQSLLNFSGTPLVVDVPADKIELINWLNSIGFVTQRDFARMYLNTNLCLGKTTNQFLICGPEFG